MIKKITNMILAFAIVAASFAVPFEAADIPSDEETVIVRDEDFEDYVPGMIANGATYQPTSGDFKAMGVPSLSGDRYIRQNAVDGKGGVSVTLNAGLTGSLVSVKGKNGNMTKAVQILRAAGKRVSTATFGMQGEDAIETSYLTYSVDVKNSGKSGEIGDAGYTREVNNCFGSMTICGITFDFNKKSVSIEGDETVNPQIPAEEYKWVLPDNGTWFNIRLEIDAMEDTLSLYIDDKAICRKKYGQKFMSIEPGQLEISMASSGDGENAVYFDNLKVEKSSISTEELARIRAASAFEPLGENAMVFYPGVSRVYFGDDIEYFNGDATLTPVKIENEIFLPIRYTAEKFGYSVSWDSETASVMLSGEKEILLKSGETEYLAGGETKTLKNPVWLLSGSSFIEESDAADIFGRKLYKSETGLSILAEKEENLPKSDSDQNVTAILNLFPEASLDFEVEGGWYTMDDLLKITGVPISEMQIGGGKDNVEGYNKLRYGSSRSTEYVKSGKYSGKWDNHPMYPTLMATNVPKNWTKFNALSFWVYSETATDEHITVAALSNPNITWAQYENGVNTVNFYYVGIDIDFTGWKQFVIPLTEFEKSSDLVHGFDKIDSLNFYTRAFNYEPSPYTVLYLDDVRLETVAESELKEAVSYWQAEKAALETKINGPRDYVLEVPEIFKDVNLLDYSLLLEAKKTIERGEGAEVTRAQNELAKILEKYEITNDTYNYSDLVVNATTNIVTDAIEPYKTRFNHEFPEVVQQLTPGEPLIEEVYYKAGRAVYGYDPKFIPGYVTVWEGIKYNLYGTRACQVADSSGKWHYYDWSLQIQRWAERELGLVTFRLRDDSFYSEVHVRFDKDGDAYMLINLAGTKEDGESFFKAILCHSRDKMKTWDFYVMPRPFGKMEILEGNNEECLERPPVVLLHNYWVSSDASAGFVLPEKQADGTLYIPDEIIYCPEPTMCQAEHSGKSNFCITADNKIFFTYGVLTNKMDLPDALQAAKDRIPPNHQMWSLYEGELKDDVKTVGIPTYVRSYDLNTKEFSEPVYVGSAGDTYNDGHNWSAMSIDAEGYIHLFIIGHHYPLLYTKSAKPYDCSEWEPIEVISDGISYASIDIDKEGNIYSITRNSNRSYSFDICLQRKLKGGTWEESRIVRNWKSYYSVFGTDVYMDPETGRLYCQCKLKLNGHEVFADGFAAHAFYFPDFSWFEDDRRPVGGPRSAVKQYTSTGATPRGENTILISDDKGTTWRFALTEDLISE